MEQQEGFNPRQDLDYAALQQDYYLVDKAKRNQGCKPLIILNTIKPWLCLVKAIDDLLLFRL